MIRYSLKKTEEETRQKLRDFVPALQTWAKKYFPKSLPNPPTALASSTTPLSSQISGPQSSVKRSGSFSGLPRAGSAGNLNEKPTLRFHNTEYDVTIAKSLEIEEHIWSLMYGLKGKIDVTLEASVKHSKPPPGPAGQTVASPQIIDLPLELKSGKRYVAHEVQLIVYALLMSDRYGSWEILNSKNA